MGAVRVIQSNATDEIGIPGFNPLDCGEDDSGVAEINATVVIQVVHPAIAIAVDDDIGGVAKLVSAVA